MFAGLRPTFAHSGNNAFGTLLDKEHTTCERSREEILKSTLGKANLWGREVELSNIE